MTDNRLTVTDPRSQRAHQDACGPPDTPPAPTDRPPVDGAQNGELLRDEEARTAVFKAAASGSDESPPKASTPRQARRARKRARKEDRSLRRRWYSAVKRSGVSPGCKSWLYSLADRSDDAAKPVWGRQTKQAAEIDRCARSVRRYRSEAESAGLVRTVRSEPIQDPITGQWSRAHTNTYLFLIPPRAEAEQWRTAKQERRSHRADRYCRSTPPTEVENRPETEASSSTPRNDTPPPQPNPPEHPRRRGKNHSRAQSGDLPRFTPDATHPPPVPEPLVRDALASMRKQLKTLGNQRAALKGRS